MKKRIFSTLVLGLVLGTSAMGRPVHDVFFIEKSFRELKEVITRLKPLAEEVLGDVRGTVDPTRAEISELCYHVGQFTERMENVRSQILQAAEYGDSTLAKSSAYKNWMEAFPTRGFDESAGDCHRGTFSEAGMKRVLNLIWKFEGPFNEELLNELHGQPDHADFLLAHKFSGLLMLNMTNASSSAVAVYRDSSSALGKEVGSDLVGLRTQSVLSYEIGATMALFEIFRFQINEVLVERTIKESHSFDEIQAAFAKNFGETRLERLRLAGIKGNYSRDELEFIQQAAKDMYLSIDPTSDLLD